MKKTIIISVLMFVILVVLGNGVFASEDKISINVNTSWTSSDVENRPESITVKLLANGTETGKSIVVTAASNYCGNFSDLDKYDENNELIVYTIKEDAIFGYTTEINNELEDNLKEIYAPVEEVTDGNDYVISIQDWTDGNKDLEIKTDDNNNIVTNPLTLNDEGNIENVNEEDTWTINKNEDGTVTINKEGNYDLTIQGHQNWNWGTPYYTYDATVTDYVKAHDGSGWDGDTQTNNNNKPSLIKNNDNTFKLKATMDWGPDNPETGMEGWAYYNQAGGIGIGPQDWSGNFRIFGKKLVEKIEKTVYTMTLINSPTERTEVKVTKEWKDDPSKHEGEEFEIRLLANGQETGRKITISSNTNWKGTFQNVIKYDNYGKKIVYSLSEDATQIHTSETENKKVIYQEDYFVVIKTDEPLEDGDYIVAFFDWYPGNNEYRTIWTEGDLFRYGELGFVHESEEHIIDTKGDEYDEYLLVSSMPEYMVWNITNTENGIVMRNNGRVLALRAEQYNASQWGWQGAFNYYFVPVYEGINGWYNPGQDWGGTYGSNYNPYLEIGINESGEPNHYIGSRFAYDGNYRDENGIMINKPWYGSFRYDENMTWIPAFETIGEGGSFKFLKKVRLEVVEEDPYEFIIYGDSTPEHPEINDPETKTLPKTGNEWKKVIILTVIGTMFIMTGIILEKRKINEK